MPQVKAAFKAEVERATNDHDKAVADLRTTTENALRNSENELKNLQKQLQEHYVGIYLMSEQGIMLKNPDWVLSNMAQAYMNGATVTKESLAQQAEAANTTATTSARESTIEEVAPRWVTNQEKLEQAGKTARPFDDNDEQGVLDAAKKVGYKGNISFINDPDQKWDGEFNPKTGEIRLNRAYLSSYDVDALQTNPAKWVLMHEMYHFIKNQKGDLGAQFHKAVVDMVKKNSPAFARLGADASETAYKAKLQEIMDKWNADGINVKNLDEAEEELVSLFSQHYLFGTESSIKMLARTNGNLVEQMLGWLRYKIDRAKLRRSKESWAREILDLERMYAVALREANNATPEQTQKNVAAKYDVAKGYYDYSRSFGEQIDDWQNGRWRTGDSFVLGETGKLYRDMGLTALPMTLNPHHVYYALNDDAYYLEHPNTIEGDKLDHAYDRSEFEKLPQKINNPIAVIRSESIPEIDPDGLSIVAYVEMTAKSGKKTIVPIKIDGTTTQNGDTIDTHHVLSVYGKTDYIGMLERAFQKEARSNGKEQAVYYWNKDAVMKLANEKKAAQQGDGGLHLPARLPRTAFPHSLRDGGKDVKERIANQTKTRQFKKWFGDSVVTDPSLHEQDPTISPKAPRVVYETEPGSNRFTSVKPSEDATGYYLHIENPANEDFDEYTEVLYDGDENAAKDALIKEGHDGTMRTNADGSISYVVFNDADVKEANDGNIGLFDKHNTNRKYSMVDSAKTMGNIFAEDEYVPAPDEKVDEKYSVVESVPGTRVRDDSSVLMEDEDISDEYSLKDWTPRPPEDMIVDGKFVGKDNPETGVTKAEDEEYMQAVLNDDWEKVDSMFADFNERNGVQNEYHGESRLPGTYDSINWDEFRGQNYFTTPSKNGAASYASRNFAAGKGIGRYDNGMRNPGAMYDMVDSAVTDMAATLGRPLHVDLSYVTEDSLVEGTEYEYLMGSELSPAQAHKYEDVPMRRVWRVYDDDGNVLARTYPAVDTDRGRTTDLFGMLEELRAYIYQETGELPDTGLDMYGLAGGIQRTSILPGDTYELDASSNMWDDMPAYHAPGTDRVDVSIINLDGKGSRIEVINQETGEVWQKDFKGFSPSGLLSFKTYDVKKWFDDTFGKGQTLFDYIAKKGHYKHMFPSGDESTGNLYSKGIYVFGMDEDHSQPDSMPVTVEEIDERVTTDSLGEESASFGYDKTIVRNLSDAASATDPAVLMDDTLTHNPNLVKSGYPVEVYRDGSIVPLSERYNRSRNDMRRSVAGFDVGELLNQYGAIDQGREPRARDVQVPKQTNDYNRVSQWIRSLIESGKLTDDQAQNVLRMVVEQDYGTYVPTSQAERMEEARAYIAERQPLQAQQEFHDMVMQGKFGVKTNALGIQLLSDASARGDIASVLDIAADLQLAATEAGQSAQIFNVLKELKGVGSAWYMQKVIDRMNSKYADKIKSGKMQKISVDPALMANLAKATTVDQMAAAEEAVAKDIARQLPLTWDDRLSSWRYFSMLANPTTHIRNITGNLLMKGLNTAKDAVATGLENVLGVDQSERAHALLTAADKSTWGDWVQQSYEEQARNLSGGSKLGFESFVKQNMRSFDTKWLNALAQFNFKLLEDEDIKFIRPAYKNALMQYMKAQGYTLNEKGQAGKVDAKGQFREMTKAQMNEAIDWASQQAWKQTFRDASSLATMLNKLSKENAVSRLLVEGVMPFKKTPINIARRGVDYSPAGIIKGIAQLTSGVKNGKVTTAQAIDTLSSGITGSALMALGVMLAKLGVIRAGGEKDKKLETYLEDTGDQTYAMKFGDKSINMSSIAPATIPLFMGVALNEMIEQGGDSLDLSTITDTIAGTLNPFMEMSFMSSLNSALKNYNTNGIGGALGSTLLTAAQNYGSQYIPTLGGKIAQFLDPTRRTTKSDATSPIGGNMDYYLRSLAKKVPGVEATLQPDVDVWGRTDTKDSFGEWALDFFNKFILPTNVKVTNRDEVDNELIRVVESTGVTDFLPSDGNKYFTVKGEKYTMNARQYAQYSQERGQAAYAAIKELMQSPSYINATDETKAEMLKKAREAAYKTVNNIWKDRLGAFNH